MFVLASIFPSRAAEWKQVRDKMEFNISGMALLSHTENRTEFLVVHDNKKPTEPRVGVVTTEGNKVDYRTLAWPAERDLPIDLESVSALPNYPGQFIALESAGHAFRFSVGEKGVAILGDFTLPDLVPKVNIEGFSVQALNGKLVAIWGERGAGTEPGILHWGYLDLESQQICCTAKAEITVPYPAPSDPNTRHISDLKLDSSGIVWISAANDPGDKGPFISAIYTAGTLRSSAQCGLQFEKTAALTTLWTFSKKVEALEFVPGPTGGIALGTDDEENGAWIHFK